MLYIYLYIAASWWILSDPDGALPMSYVGPGQQGQGVSGDDPRSFEVEQKIMEVADIKVSLMHTELGAGFKGC